MAQKRRPAQRVLILTHQRYAPPPADEAPPPQEIEPFKTEYSVTRALEALGHEVRVLGGADDLTHLREIITEWRPHVAVNLMEEFGGAGYYVPYVLGYLELMRVPFTGCNPTGLMLADDKELMKKLLRYHRIPAPDFAVFARGRRVRRPRRLGFPLIVKSATAHGSVGIAQASLVTSDEKLAERVEFIHDHVQTDAMAEQYIEGRELYLGMLGNRRLETFPVWEMYFENLAEGAPRIATARVKWDQNYQAQRGITTGPAANLPDGTAPRITRLCRRVYRMLGLSGYARMDFRLAEDGRLFLLEPNPNPDLSDDEDFADAAAAAGMDYQKLIRRVLSLGIRYFGEQPAGQSDS
jgi:D-alanine-D-alanine ligase